MKPINLDFTQPLKEALQNKPLLIQVILGPRQVGKTTTILKLLKTEYKNTEYFYCSADEVLSPDEGWILSQHQNALEKKEKKLLIIDEIQQIDNWSSIIKRLWDKQKLSKQKLHFILLGSSSLKIQKGLTESLAGRYELHIAHHWNTEESKKAYNISLEDFIIFGGYPQSYPLITDIDKWVQYINMSIVDAVIGKDILNYAKIKSPALFRQCFELLISYSCQEISYTKLLGHLQGKGHVDQIKYYLELFESAFLIKSLPKYSRKAVLKKSSSPKILPLCSAFYGAQKHGELSSEERGRAFEIIVGSMLNRLNGKLFYWREGSFEVDFVLEKGKALYAIEVKSNKKRPPSGLNKFKQKFPEAKICFITPENVQAFTKQKIAFLEQFST